MADISTEPSMEEILSSIKRIIAEEGDTPTRGRRSTRGPAAPPREEGDDEVLELSDPMPPPEVTPREVSSRRTDPVSTPQPKMVDRPAKPEPAPTSTVAEPAPAAEPIVSPETAEASRGPLEALSRLLVKPEPNSDGTLEGLVREMLRPMLREWLDTNLPPLVEKMVAREIAKIGAR